MAGSFDRSATQLLTELTTSGTKNGTGGSSSSERRKRRSFILDETFEEGDFSSRLKTFSSSLWSCKPNDISALVCCRYGWVCIEKDLLQCISCKNYLSGHLPSPIDVNIYRKCVDRLRSSLIDAHTNTCKWRSSFLSEDDIAPNILDYDEILSNIKSRLDSFKENNVDVSVPISGAADLDVKADEISDVKEICGKDCEPFIVLVLCGWQAGSSERTLYCKQCNRTVGLWLFSGDSNNAVKDDSSISPARKKRRNSVERQLLNPISQHQSWCPWLSIATSNSVLHQLETPLPRWRAALKILLRRYRNEHKLKIETNSDITNYFVIAQQLLNETVVRVVEATSTE